MGRAPCCDKANVKKGPWSPEEDAKLKSYIDKYGTGGNWIALPQKIGLKRCGKSCRLRWLNYLRPNIKHGGFSEEEDNIICSLYISIGSRWSIIAAQLPGRTDNDIKNYWNTRLKKKLLGRRKQQQQQQLHHQQSPEGSPATAMATATGHHDHQDHHHQNPTPPPSSNGLSNSALERLQLHMKLQTLNQNPLLHNMLWPKLHPFQEKLLLQAMNDENNSNNMQLPLLPQPITMDQSPLSTIGKPQQQQLEDHDQEMMINPSSNYNTTTTTNETIPMTTTTSSNTTTTTTTTTTNTNEMDRSSSPNLMNTNNINVSSYGGGGAFQLGGGDDFIMANMGNLDNGASSLVWWSNEFDTNVVNYDRSGSFSSSTNDSTWECDLRSSDAAGLF